MASIVPSGIPIERGKIHEFANAILDDDPYYHDETFAKAQGHPSVVAPPTYLQVAAFFVEGLEAMLAELNLDLRFVLHGEQAFFFNRPICAGDILVPEKGEVKEYEKQGRRGGTMRFIELETLYRDQKGEIAARSLSTIIQTGGVVSS